MIRFSDYSKHVYTYDAKGKKLGDDSREYLSTISNVISVLGIHEFTEHQKKGLGENLHWKILENQKNIVLGKKSHQN